MLVIHNGTDTYPIGKQPKLVREGSTVKTPDGNFVGPASDGLDLGGGWRLEKPQAADPIPAGYEANGTTLTFEDGKPKYTQNVTPIPQGNLQASRALEMQTKCRNQILAVADELTQLNLSSSYSSNRMTQADEATYLAGLDWKDAMVAHCRALISDPNLAENWPIPSPEIIALVEKY